ncbi:hypothetical protein L798_03463, partial [Zootermopsis nevadensis]
GHPPHSSVHVTEYLSDLFTDRWIGRGGPKKWPPRSSDFAPEDVLVWGYVKKKANECKVNTR